MASLKGIFPGPFAGPKTQQDYEAALGRFLVAFNALEDSVRSTVRLILRRRSCDDMWPLFINDMFRDQVKTLEVLSRSIDRFPVLPYEAMRSLNDERNALAHGHYEQDLFNESFALVARGKTREFPIPQIHRFTDLAIDVGVSVRETWPILWFEKLE